MSNAVELNQYQIVSSFEGERKMNPVVEEGKKYRQFLAAVLCKWTLMKLVYKLNSKLSW